jgi:hypothetical protein
MHTGAINHFDSIAPAPLNSAAPLLPDHCVVARRNCMAPRVLVDRVAALRSCSFLPRLSVMGEEPAGERCLGFYF